MPIRGAVRRDHSVTRVTIDRMDAKQVWRAALGELQVSLSPANFETWLRDTNLIDVDPMLKDPANGDFSTKPDSPARGAAKDGKDIGAWQSGDGPPDPEPEPEPEPDGELEERVDDLETRMQALESWAGSFNK